MLGWTSGQRQLIEVNRLEHFQLNENYHAMCLFVFFLKNCSAVILWHPYQLKSSPSNLMVFLAQQILIWTVDLHGFLYNPIYKPTERNQAFQSQSTLCSRELAREGSCGTVRWSRACVSPVLWPALPPAASTSEEPEVQVAHCHQVQEDVFPR